MTNNINFDADPFYGGLVSLHTTTVTYCKGTCFNWVPDSSADTMRWDKRSLDDIIEMEEETRSYCEGHDHYQFHDGGRLLSFDAHKCSYCDRHTRVRISLGTSSFDQTKLEYTGRCVVSQPDMLTIYIEDDSAVHFGFSRRH